MGSHSLPDDVVQVMQECKLIWFSCTTGLDNAINKVQEVGVIENYTVNALISKILMRWCTCIQTSLYCIEIFSNDPAGSLKMNGLHFLELEYHNIPLLMCL